MLHAVKISKGEATFCSRYVKTYKHVTERKTGHPIFQSVFSSFNNGLMATMARCLLTAVRILSGHYNPMANGFGPANTSLALFSGKLFALCESDLPYEIKLTPDGDIITLGRRTLNNERILNMTAHPKIDLDTGEVVAFSYNIMRPFLTYLRISSDGREQKEVPIFSMKRASFVHDFAVTKNYAIFPDLQIVIDAMEIMRGRSPVRIDASKTPRLGFIPRYASDESRMCWVDVPGLNMLHVVNAWEEEDDDGGKIVIVASNVLPIEHALDRMDLVHSSLEKITIDAEANKLVTRFPISAKTLDFGVINPQYAGKNNRYVYAAVTDPAQKVAGVMKLDLSLTVADPITASRMYGPGCYGGEPFFVPREADNPDADEDDGYLITYVHNEYTEKSRFIVMDAKSTNLDIIADVTLPARVPYGFHGIFVKEKDLNNL
ncbi:probable carotenoid cleavage dioxygenase 4 chloroplastic [Phtheirospermum japonicum]|uniref:Probable carotenoid cleavage dioxygenase 4 chloroplastic n=1 Tax=Phtheirospermum japonicum TaxID=374723 RepID=A0A830B9U1_9LAMI|nr:probable carotenoid cleavage dioxygenase 4 chloroplastic [Phtheirospermum japonicum]